MMNRQTHSNQKNLWLNEVVRALEHYSMPDIISFTGNLSYYQQSLAEKTFAPVVLLSEQEAQKNPQGAFDGNVYFLLQCDTIQVFNNNGEMIFDKGKYLSTY